MMYIPIDHTQNYPFCRLLQLVVETFGLDTQLNEPTNQNSIKVPKVDKPKNKKSPALKNFCKQKNR